MKCLATFISTSGHTAGRTCPFTTNHASKFSRNSQLHSYWPKMFCSVAPTHETISNYKTFQFAFNSILSASTFVEREQCDHIGRILQVVANKFAYKICLKRLLTIGLFWRRSMKLKNCRGYYLGDFWKHLGNFFTPNIWSHWKRNLVPPILFS